MSEGDIAESLLLSTGIITIASQVFLLMMLVLLYVPKLKENLETVIDLMVNSWIQLQLLTSLCYINAEYSSFSLRMVRSNSSWIFTDYLDEDFLDLIGDENYDSPGDIFVSDDMSLNYSSNIATSSCIILICCLVYIAAKLLSKKFRFYLVMEFEVLLVVTKLTFFRMCLSFALEQRLILEGKSIDYNTYIAYGVCAIYLISYYLPRFVYRNKIDTSNRTHLRKIGGEYRQYRDCSQGIHSYLKQLHIFVWCTLLIFIAEWTTFQFVSLLALDILYLLYIFMFNPFSQRIYKIDELLTLGLRDLVLVCIFIGYQTDDSTIEDILVMISLSIALIFKQISNIILFKSTVSAVRSLIDKEIPEGYEEPPIVKHQTVIKADSPKIKQVPERMITKRSEIEDQSQDISLQKMYTKKEIAESEIDPRLQRRRRKKRKAGNS